MKRGAPRHAHVLIAEDEVLIAAGLRMVLDVERRPSSGHRSPLVTILILLTNLPSWVAFCRRR